MQYVLHWIIYIISYIFLLNPARGDVTTQINRIGHDTLATPNAVQTWHATAHYANSLSGVSCNKPRSNHFFPAQIQSSQPQKERDAVYCVPFFSSRQSIHFDESVSMNMHTAHFAYDHARKCLITVLVSPSWSVCARQRRRCSGHPTQSRARYAVRGWYSHSRQMRCKCRCTRAG